MHDNDLGPANPLRARVFTGMDPVTRSPLTSDDHFDAVIEFLGLLDDRVKELEAMVTELATRDVPGING